MSPEPGHVMSRPRAGIGRDGRIHVIWESLLGDFYHSSAPLHGADAAPAWSKPTRIPIRSPSTELFWIVDAAGRIHLVYLEQSTKSPRYISSDDSGRTWSEPTSIADYGLVDNSKGKQRSIYMAIDGKGRIHVAWYRTTRQLDYSRSEDGGRTWTERFRVPAPPGSEVDTPSTPAIGIRGDDEIHLVWSGAYHLMPDGSLQATTKYHIWSSDGGQSWTPTEIAFENIVGNNGPNPMIADSNGTLHTIVVTGFGPGAVHWVFYSQWAGNRWLPLVALPGSKRATWDDIGPSYNDLALSEGNRLNVVWQTRDGDIWYARREIDAPFIPPQPALTAGPEMAESAATPPLPSPRRER